MIEEKINNIELEEQVINVEIYVECLVENVQKFKLINKPSFFIIQEFILEYINLEEKILNMFQQLDKRKLKRKHKNIIDNLLILFNSHWKDFQDSWDEQMWKIYEGTKKNDIKVNIANFQNFHDERLDTIEVNLF